MFACLRLWLLPLAAFACATGSETRTPSSTAAVAPRSRNPERCEHQVARDTCVLCHPDLVAQFKSSGDWCPEHGVPESQCLKCHPQLTSAASTAPGGADVTTLSAAGEDVPSLDVHAVPGKVTLFDFYADWCAPCRDIDQHVYTLLKNRSDVAYRKLNVVSWETPLAKRHLVAAKVASLPYVVVYGKDGKRLRAISGFDLGKLDQAVKDGGAR